MKDYEANASRLKVILPTSLGHEASLAAALKLCCRASTTEFEYKAARHALRGRKKKELISSRASEYTVITQKDWKNEAHSDLVKHFESILSGTGP